MANQKGIQNLKKRDQALLKLFGEIIRQERTNKEWTLEDTEAHGYPNWQHWQAVESGLKNITFTTLLNICRTLKIPPHKLLKKISSKMR